MTIDTISLQSNFDNYKTAFNSLANKLGDLASLTDSAASVVAAINALNITITALDSDITALQTANAGDDSDILALQVSITALDSDLTVVINTTIANLDSSLSASIANTDSDVAALLINFNILDSDIAGFKFTGSPSSGQVIRYDGNHFVPSSQVTIDETGNVSMGKKLTVTDSASFGRTSISTELNMNKKAIKNLLAYDSAPQYTSSRLMEYIDINELVELYGTNLTYTVQQYSTVAIPPKAIVDVINYDSSNATILAGTGVTLKGNVLVPHLQMVSLIHRDSNVWYVIGGS